MSTGRYALVSCRRCKSFWIIDMHESPKHTECTGCGCRYRTRKLRKWHRSDDIRVVRDKRGSLLSDPKRQTNVGDARSFGPGIETFASARRRVQAGVEALAPSESLASDRPTTEFEDLLEAKVDDRLDEMAPASFEATSSPVATDLEETQLVDAEYRPNLDEKCRREQDDTLNTGVRFLTPGDEAPLAPIQGDVSPGTRRREWLPGLVEDLLQTLCRELRARVADRDPAALEEHRRPTGAGDILEELHEAGVTATDGVWASVLLTYAVRYVDDAGSPSLPASEDVLEQVTDGWREQHEEQREALRRQLVAPGTGAGTFSADLEEFRAGFVAAFDELVDDDAAIRVRLSADEWGDLGDTRTARRSLEALEVLSRVAEVRLQVSSGSVASTLADEFSGWLEEHVDLTPLYESYRCTRGEASQKGGAPVDADEVESVLDGLSDGSGKVRLIATLEDDTRSVRALKDDPAVTENLSESSVDVFLSELEGDGVVSIDRRSGSSNRVSLTSLGAAVAKQISSDLAVRPPLQSSLTTVLGQPANLPQVQCAERSGTREGGEDSTATPEDWLADTGDPAAGADYVQWLQPLSQQVDAWVMQKRITAAARTGGVTLIDDRISEFEDGRVAYIGGLDDELLVQVQGVKPLPLLGRLNAALLSDKALGKVLDVDRVGEQFENLHGGAEAWQQWKNSVDDVFRAGQQMGWFSETEDRWDDLRFRWKGVKNALLSKVAELSNSSNLEKRGELMRKLHGLRMSTTQLLYAAGVDLYINFRLPDVANLEGDDYLKASFLNFLKETVPRHGAYTSETGVHSWWRQTCETREEKLKSRLSPGYDESEPLAEPTVSWVITGPSATDLQEDIRRAIDDGVQERVRDRVASGAEGAPALEVPVVKGTTYGAIKRIVRELTGTKGYTVAREGSLEAGRVGADLDRLTRLFIRTLATDDRPHECSPISVAHALLTLRRSSKAHDYIQVRDIEYALSQLPPERLFPNHRPTVTSFFQSVLAAKEPIGQADIVASSPASERTYRRRLDELEEFVTLGLLEERQVDGHRRFTASIEPWWESETSRSEKPTSSPLSAGSSRDDVLFELACAAGLDVSGDEWLWPRDVEEIYRANEELRRWRAYLMGVFDPPGEHIDGPPPTVLIGRLPEAVDERQVSLATAAAPGAASASYSDRPTGKSPEGEVGRSD